MRAMRATRAMGLSVGLLFSCTTILVHGLKHTQLRGSGSDHLGWNEGEDNQVMDGDQTVNERRMSSMKNNGDTLEQVDYAKDENIDNVDSDKSGEYRSSLKTINENNSPKEGSGNSMVSFAEGSREEDINHHVGNSHFSESDSHSSENSPTQEYRRFRNHTTKNILKNTKAEVINRRKPESEDAHSALETTSSQSDESREGADGPSAPDSLEREEPFSASMSALEGDPPPPPPPPVVSPDDSSPGKGELAKTEEVVAPAEGDTPKSGVSAEEAPKPGEAVDEPSDAEEAKNNDSGKVQKKKEAEPEKAVEEPMEVTEPTIAPEEEKSDEEKIKAKIERKKAKQMAKKQKFEALDKGKMDVDLEKGQFKVSSMGGKKFGKHYNAMLKKQGINTKALKGDVPYTEADRREQDKKKMREYRKINPLPAKNY